MRRPAAAVLGTMAGATLLLGAKLGTRPHPDLGAVVTGPPAGHPGGPGSSADPSVPGRAATVPQPSGTPAATRPAATSHAPTQTRVAPTRASALRSGTSTGVAVTHKYGTLQVTITVASGKMTDAQASYVTSLKLSTQITGDALPKLRQEALVAQSADIATVSGATYTSDAYRTSLQSALDRAKG